MPTSSAKTCLDMTETPRWRNQEILAVEPVQSTFRPVAESGLTRHRKARPCPVVCCPLRNRECERSIWLLFCFGKDGLRAVLVFLAEPQERLGGAVAEGVRPLFCR